MIRRGSSTLSIVRHFLEIEQKSQSFITEICLVNHAPLSSLVGEGGEGVELLFVSVPVARFHFYHCGRRRRLNLSRGATESLQEPNLFVKFDVVGFEALGFPLQQRDLLEMPRLRVLQLLVPLTEPLPLRVHDRQEGRCVCRSRRRLLRHWTLEELLLLPRGEVHQGVGHQNVS